MSSLKEKRDFEKEKLLRRRLRATPFSYNRMGQIVDISTPKKTKEYYRKLRKERRKRLKKLWWETEKQYQKRQRHIKKHELRAI